MDELILTILNATCVIASFTVFFAMLKVVLPKLFLKIKYSVNDLLGRGIKKLTYKDGRAVLYEPHPKFRKFINKYLLFTNEGYKYLICKVDQKVRYIRFNVVMFDNKHNAIDSISVSAYVNGSFETEPVLLHHNTSYVSISVDCVNNNEIYNENLQSIKLFNIALYSISVMILFFIELMFLSNNVLSQIFLYFKIENIDVSMSLLSGISWSVLIGIFTFIIALIKVRNKGIKVVKNARR